MPFLIQPDSHIREHTGIIRQRLSTRLAWQLLGSRARAGRHARPFVFRACSTLDGESMPLLTMNLDPNGVAAPATHAAITAGQVVAASLNAFAEGELGELEMQSEVITYRLNGPTMDSEERRAMYQNWLLGKGFQDLARGIRGTLEEAALYLTFVIKNRTVTNFERLHYDIQRTRKRASKLSFPSLLSEVNARLTERVAFEAEFRSIQRVRNCLEHRNGVVGSQDVDEEGVTLTLSFPRHKIFYMRAGEEIEIALGERVDASDQYPEVQILGRLVTRTRTYELGERVTFTASDFYEIAMACHFFAIDLVSKLPTVQA
jgi:hypothetical protein